MRDWAPGIRTILRVGPPQTFRSQRGYELNVGISTLTRFHLFDLARELDSRGALGNIYTGYPRRKIPAELRERSVSRPFPLAFVGLARFLSNVPALQHVTNRLGVSLFDAAVANSLRPHDILVGLAGQSILTFNRARSLGAKIVCERGSAHIQFQNTILEEEYGIWGLPYRPIDKRVIEQELEEYAMCDRIAVPSWFAHQSFVERGIPQSKLFRNPYGVNLTDFQPGIKKDSVFRIIFVGSLSIRKGLGYLLRAAELLRGCACEILLVGRAEKDVAKLLQCTKASVRHCGPVPRAVLPRYYAQASLMVLPSIEEGLAVVQAQAMACGIPVIATPNTGANDLFEDGKEGFIVPIRSPGAIADRIERLMKDPELLDQMRVRCLERVRSMGGWSDYGARALECYRAMAEGAP